MAPGQNRWLPRVALPAGVLLWLLIGGGFASQPYVGGLFLPEDIVPYWQQKQINNKYDASLPWMIIPRAAQQEVTAYIEQMPPEAHIYYLEAYKGAEISAANGRIQYPIARRSQPGVKPHPDDIILIPSSIISRRDPIVRQSVLPLIEQACPDPAKNDYYRLCRVSDITGLRDD